MRHSLAEVGNGAQHQPDRRHADVVAAVTAVSPSRTSCPHGGRHGSAIMIERHIHPSADELQHQEFYTLEEAAHVLMIGINSLRHAVFTGELPAQIVGHHIVAVGRHEILVWLHAIEDISQAG